MNIETKFEMRGEITDGTSGAEKVVVLPDAIIVKMSATHDKTIAVIPVAA